ncbi:MAG: kelch repeat-containing protein, partial [Planctomycetota bacterium]
MPSPLRSWSLRCWPALALPLLPDLAQAQVDLSWTDGVLGSAVNFSIDAAPTAPLGVLLPSFNVGPTPLSLLDPFDPRVLGVGLDLFAFAAVVPLDPLGDATVSFPLPANPALAGTALLAQAITLPGTQTLVDGVSNRVSFVLAQPGDSHPALGDDVLARRWATTIPLDDGSVLVAGGLVPRGAAGTPGFAATDRVSRFDPETQTYSELSAGLPRAFGRSRSVTMADGRTLIAGGLDANGATATCVVYDPASGQFTQVGSMQQPRVFHTLNALPDGRVLAAGGSSAFTPGHPIGHPAATAQFVASTELFNPSSGTWSAGPLLPVRTTMHEAATLAGGRVLLTGGISLTATALQPVTSDEAYFFLAVSNLI